MIRIKTPATSANLSVGFDTLGLALNIYNTFLFNESSEYKLNGFSELYSSDSNLVLNAYINFAKKFLDEKSIKKVKITSEKNHIPASRGLGSSASCILAGVLASNEINKLNKTFKECVDFSCTLEGHSDNVYACAYGFLTASLKKDDTYLHKVFQVSDKLFFYLLISNTKGSTKELRDILPKKVDLSDAVHNLSRIIFLPDAYKNGDLKLLKSVSSDRLHESYRYPYVPLYYDIKKLSKKDNLIVCISGSGPSVLLISNSDNLEVPSELLKVYEFIKVKVSNGVEIEVVK